MDTQQVNGFSSEHHQNGHEDDFELMGDVPKEDPVVVERRRTRNNEITKKLGAYLLKGYCMLSDACPECDCILLRTPERQLLCVGCAEVDAENKTETANGNNEEATGSDQRGLSAQSLSKKKDRVKRAKKRNKKLSTGEGGESVLNDGLAYSEQLETKLKWAVDELTKSHNPSRINAMCDVIVKLTVSIKALKEHEMGNIQH